MEYYIRPQGKFSLNLKELWQYRELFWFFTWRDIKVKYKQTLLGFLWAVLQPLLMMSVFVIFFSKGLNIPTDDIPAPIFYFSGLLFWNLFSSGLSSSANSMVVNADIIKKIYFPRLIIPFSGILVAFFDFLMAFLIFIIFIAFYLFIFTDFTIQPVIFLYFPLALTLTLITTLGMGCTLAALNVKYRDFRYVIPFAIQFLMFITPVIYPVTIFDNIPNLKYFLALNPMTGAIILARNAFVPGMVDWTIIGISIASAFFFFLLGIFIFRKMEAYFADIV
ncbi:MAG: ABC transporter permease [Bacteroidetes bacterium]|jgi:lipopolysaccharide transport system permease protein|nr:ABC transporter permease [Bacteroidota bacterium]MDF1864899.1 ABC transporter permease [Saprospiraceae bacterium]